MCHHLYLEYYPKLIEINGNPPSGLSESWPKSHIFFHMYNISMIFSSLVCPHLPPWLICSHLLAVNTCCWCQLWCGATLHRLLVCSFRVSVSLCLWVLFWNTAIYRQLSSRILWQKMIISRAATSRYFIYLFFFENTAEDVEAGNISECHCLCQWWKECKEQSWNMTWKR